MKATVYDKHFLCIYILYYLWTLLDLLFKIYITKKLERIKTITEDPKMFYVNNVQNFDENRKLVITIQILIYSSQNLIIHCLIQYLFIIDKSYLL